MRGSKRFYLDVVGIALLGALVGYLVATRGWVSSAFWATWLVVAIVQFSLRHGPGAAARQAVEKRRKDAEREYDQRETWGSWPT